MVLPRIDEVGDKPGIVQVTKCVSILKADDFFTHWVFFHDVFYLRPIGLFCGKFF